MSDWSYRYGKPRSQVHYERYGTTSVPARRGKGGSSLGNPNSINLFILGAIFFAGIVTFLASKKS